MNNEEDDHMLAIAHSLGDVSRDFKENPLSQQEIEAVITTYSKELMRQDLDPDLKNLYNECIEVLKKHLTLH